MRSDINLFDEFGPSLADGGLAVAFARREINPYVGSCNELVLDFGQVRIANSSFINALVATIFEAHGIDSLSHLQFRGCNKLLQVLIESAITLSAERFGTHQPR